MKVLFLGTIPDSEDKNKGIFNYRAVIGISQMVHIDSISIRIWKPGRKFIKKIIKENNTFHYISILYIPILFNFKSLLYIKLKYYSYILKIYLKISRIDYNLIHSVGADVYGIIGSQLSKRGNTKHLIQLTGSDINSIIPDLLENKIVKKKYFSFDVLVANNRELIPKWNEIFSENIKNRYIYRGVDLKIFQNYPINKTGSVKFLFMGGLQKYDTLPYNMNTKGGITLMIAWSLIDKENINAKLFYGGPNTDIDTFHKWKKSLKNPEKVELIGKLAPSKIYGILKKVSVVIIPSLEEGLPNFGVESIAVGRPIIGTKIGGIPDIIGEDEAGWLIKSNDPYELFKKIKYLCENSSEIYDRNEASRNRAERYFDYNLFSKNYIKIYKEMMFDIKVR